jgi:hypothetical protein
MPSVAQQDIDVKAYERRKSVGSSQTAAMLGLAEYATNSTAWGLREKSPLHFWGCLPSGPGSISRFQQMKFRTF